MNDLIFSENLEQFFQTKVEKLSTNYNTKAYIGNVFTKPIKDLGSESLTLEFARAKRLQQFSIYQNLADWILFISSVGRLQDELYFTLGQLSYYNCYRLMNKQWILFEELADRLPIIVRQLQSELRL